MAEKEKRPPLPDEYDPFGKTFPDKKNPTSPAEVEIPKAPEPQEGADNAAEFAGLAGLFLILLISYLLITRSQGGDSAVYA